MLWLVTPVHGREALTRVVFEQRARMLDELASLGEWRVEARQLVVGDDGNLDTAREFGFHVLERPNVLGLRVNDGFEWAIREGGADFVAYCGSDDWHLAEFFTQLPGPDFASTSWWQAFVHPRGNRLVTIRGNSPYGHAPWIIPRQLLESCAYRPAQDDAMSAVDGSIAEGIGRAVQKGLTDWHERRLARKRAFRFNMTADELRMVDFKAGGEQITPWERVVGVKRPRHYETDAPFEKLATRYPADLCERMERFYATKEAR